MKNNAIDFTVLAIVAFSSFFGATLVSSIIDSVEEPSLREIRRKAFDEGRYQTLLSAAKAGAGHYSISPVSGNKVFIWNGADGVEVVGYSWPKP
jgi:hypothetical protein